MATTPHKPTPPLRDPSEGKSPAIGGGHLTTQEERDKDRPGPSGYRQTIGVKGEPIDDGERDPDTIAEEQRRRSDEMEKEGVEKWKAARDERTPEEREGKAIPGSQPRRIEGHKAP